MTGKWDGEKTLADELRRNNYFDSENMIDKFAREGPELKKLPEHFVLDPVAKKELIKDCDKMVDNLEGLDAMADYIMGFLRGYSYGQMDTALERKLPEL